MNAKSLTSGIPFDTMGIVFGHSRTLHWADGIPFFNSNVDKGVLYQISVYTSNVRDIVSKHKVYVIALDMMTNTLEQEKPKPIIVVGVRRKTKKISFVRWIQYADLYPTVREAFENQEEQIEEFLNPLFVKPDHIVSKAMHKVDELWSSG